MTEKLFNSTLELDSTKTHPKSRFCPRFKGMYFFNLEKKTWSPCNCNAYECAECGKYKEMKLRLALEGYLKTWPFCRMWTFTYKASIFSSKADCYNKSSKIWKYFITYLRRSERLSKSQQKISYIKFLEVHKSGIIHYHVVFNRYLDANQIRALWRSAISAVTGKSGYVGNINIADNKSKKSTASYISKYVTKAARSRIKKLRSWSKSERITIFPNRPKNPAIICRRVRNLDIILKSNSITSQMINFSTYNNQNHLTINDEFGEIIYDLILTPKKE